MCFRSRVLLPARDDSQSGSTVTPGDHRLLRTSQRKEIHIIEISLYSKSIHVLLNLWNVVFNAVSSINEISASSAVLM